MKSFFRLCYIIYICIHYGLDECVLKRFRPSRLFAWLPKARKRLSKPLGERLTLAIIDLGPIFIKFGQMMSTRPDIFTPSVTQSLSRLQDNVPPFSSKEAIAIIEQELNNSISDLFASFEDQPLASASVAQVHGAILHNGQNVVVKIIRPDIEPMIHKDIKLLYFLAKCVKPVHHNISRFRVINIIKEFEYSLFNELDLTRESANLNQLKRNFKDDDRLNIPSVKWSHSTSKVLTMERVYGIRIDDRATIHQHHIDVQKLAEDGVEIFFTQVFRDRFFHADMHPGNFFVDLTQPHEPFFHIFDLGIVGTLSVEDQYYLAQNFLAFFDRDYYRVALLHVESNWVAPDTRIDQFESAIRSVCEPIFARPLKDISFGLLLLRLFEVGRAFKLVVQPQLILLQKTLFNVEGLGRSLYPDLDLWRIAEPFLRQWLAQQNGFQSIRNIAKHEWPKMLALYPKIPHLIYKALEHQAIKPHQPEPAKSHYLAVLMLGMMSGALLLIALCYAFDVRILQ